MEGLKSRGDLAVLRRGAFGKPRDLAQTPVGDVSRAWLALAGSYYAWHGGRGVEILLSVYTELDGITIRLLEPAGLVIWIWGRAE